MKTTTLNISLAKAKTEKLFYFVVTGVIYHPKLKKCLILQRSKKEVTHPGLWGVTGGKLEWKDLQENPITRKNFDVLDWEGLVEKLIMREAKEESGLEVVDPRYIDSVVYLRPDGVPTVCFKFAVKLKKGKVKITPEFDGFAWVNSREVRGYKCIQGIQQEIVKVIKLYSTPSHKL
ncbi:MAG: NUDIX domain-containing protein [Candidatus Daviesbacteria bacterium]|nr:MAG: NUDIX domain-containing protein [Candidatus Daviesbacteria bacterium]